MNNLNYIQFILKSHLSRFLHGRWYNTARCQSQLLLDVHQLGVGVLHHPGQPGRENTRLILTSSAMLHWHLTNQRLISCQPIRDKYCQDQPIRREHCQQIRNYNYSYSEESINLYQPIRGDY